MTSWGQKRHSSHLAHTSGSFSSSSSPLTLSSHPSIYFCKDLPIAAHGTSRDNRQHILRPSQLKKSNRHCDLRYKRCLSTTLVSCSLVTLVRVVGLVRCFGSGPKSGLWRGFISSGWVTGLCGTLCRAQETWSAAGQAPRSWTPSRPSPGAGTPSRPPRSPPTPPLSITTSLPLDNCTESPAFKCLRLSHVTG